MSQGELKEGLSRRAAKLWKVLVVSGMALAAGCASMSKDRTGSSGSDPGPASSGSSNNGSGGGASGW
ncbi:MAG TPA: hypothetical protein VFG59_06200 [Anaeromyxobacter sp.]|nr:hypothetical protein [Anaeromyxobacter sp.]